MRLKVMSGLAGLLVCTVFGCKPQTAPGIFESAATPTSECYGHSDCASGTACIDGQCGGSLDEPMSVSVDATQFFVDPNGGCVWDGECGPWVCQMGRCTDPADAGLSANYPPRRRFVYWDMSCNSNDDCGGWACAGGFCVNPDRLPEGYVDPISGRPGHGDGRTCLSDTDCGGDECVNPGFCHPHRGWEQMTFADIDVSSYNSSGGCSTDDECGPWLCDYGTCRPGEQTANTLPRRSELAYYDGSCSSNANCGSWQCVNSWCRPYAGSNYGSSPSTGSYVGTSCGSDDQCGYDGECLWPGECWTGNGGELMTWSDVDASTWYTYSDGSCYADSDCGPWVCWGGYCTAPEYTSLYRPARSEIYYYDGSCSSDSECGSWLCDGTWCRESSRTSGVGALNTYSGGSLGVIGTGTGATCAEHSACGSSEACVPPGVCEYGRLYETWNPDDMNIRHYVTSGSCSQDSDCGPWLCDYGTCVSPYTLGLIPPQRWEITYYDGSCYTDAECGSWSCYDGWCRDQSRSGY